MAMNAKLMRLLASIDPRLWEVLFPPQPPWLKEIARGPLPDPWQDDLGLQAQIAARDIALRIIDAASAVSAQGGDSVAVIIRSVRDWASVDDGDGTGQVPFDIPFPRHWRFDRPRPPRPNEKVALIPVLAAAAWTFATAGDSVGDREIGAAIDEAFDILTERIDQLANVRQFA